ncbi:MAG: RimK family alpha-L-glutamate ligase [Gammaproteobacteria bacterium]
MISQQWTCAFLSTENVRPDIVDDHHAIEPLTKLGVAIETHPWRAENIDWARFDLVIVRSTWDYHEHVDEFFAALEQIEACGARLANPREVMHWNRQKTYLADLERRGVPIVETVFGEHLNPEKLDELVTRFATQEWIVKPQISASAHGVFRLSGAPTSTQRQQILETFARQGFLAQPFVEDVVASGEYSLFYFDGAYSHCILKTPCAGDFRVQEEYGSDIRAVTPEPSLVATAEQVRAQLPAENLYERIDLVRDANGRYAVMEVELIEPSLYLRTHPAAGTQLAEAIVRWLKRD